MLEPIVFEFRQDLFDYPSKDFIKHIQKPGNIRILFSGKFGIGKSYFLDHFFKDKVQVAEMSDIKYMPFHLYPVNYSIASNEDIFRYLKYDIITTMLLNNVDLEENDLTYFNTLPKYLKGNLLKVLATIIYMIPKVGKDVYDSYEKIENLKDEFLKYHEDKIASEGDKLISFLEKIENKEGTIFENDIITKLIANILKRLKEKTNYENVLIIDDLDRIDPEHIFRLLNVFAAHLDNSKGQANKLGFDKIILVCDIKNLRNIFRAKYGLQTDFNGYIDKFYSYEVFQFDNRKILEEISLETFKQVTTVHGDESFSKSFIATHFRVKSLPMELLQLFISYGLINLRTLVSRTISKFELDVQRYLTFGDLQTVRQIHHIQLTHFKLLKDLVGGYDNLKEYLHRVQDNDISALKVEQYANEMLVFIHWRKTFQAEGDVSIDFNGKSLSFRVKSAKLVEKITGAYFYLEDKTIYNYGTQYIYSIAEFKVILNEFLDLLLSIEN